MADLNKNKLLKVLRRKSRALHVAEICQRLGVPRAQRAEVTRVLEGLAEEGLVTQLPGGRFRSGNSQAGAGRTRGGARSRSAPPARELRGKLSMNHRGFGFLVTDAAEPDVYIGPSNLGGAMQGDRVVAHVRPSRQGFEGRIVKIEERGTRYVDGRLHVRRAGAWIEPEDARVRGPVSVVGPRPDTAHDGSVVIARIERYAQEPHETMTARIVDVLDPSRVAEFEIRKVTLREGAREDFPEEVQREAGELPHAVGKADRSGREDLRELDLVTIDPGDARDHDDAVYARRLRGGGYRVVVAIADVSHYVRPDSPMDREARERGCTVYLPGRAIPMLPPQLSSHLASLVPNKDRLALAVEIDLGPQGGVRRHRFIEALVRSHAGLHYEGVARALGLSSRGPAQPAATRRRKQLDVLLEIARLLGTRRRRRGSLDFEIPEAKVILDEAREPLDVRRSRIDPGVAKAYNIVEELMLLANEVVATALADAGAPAIYRVHGDPDPERVETFVEVARSVGYDIDVEDLDTPKRMSAFLRRIAGTPHAGALSYLLLRAMQQATYDTQNIGHYALASKHYTHFTSPIRRYPDLAVHRLVRAVARGQHDGGETQGSLKAAAVQASERERAAMRVEREVTDIYRAMLMEDRVGESFDGRISGLAEHGLYVSLDDPFVDVLCRYSNISGDRFELDRTGVRATGTRTGQSFTLGDALRVEVENVSVARRLIEGRPLGQPQQDERAPAQRKRGGRNARRKGHGQRRKGRSERQTQRTGRDERSTRKGTRRQDEGARDTKRRRPKRKR